MSASIEIVPPHAQRERGPRSQRPDAGFTLLEAIVALTIIGISLVPIMSFLAESSRQLRVAADANLRATAQQSVLAYVEVINPTVTPTGEAALSESLTLRWASTPLVAPDSETALGGRLGGFSLAFYVVDIDVVRDGKDWFALQVRKIGYRPRSASLMPGMQQE